MTVFELMEVIPDAVKQNIIDFQDVKINLKGKKIHAIRVLLDRIFPDAADILTGDHLLYNKNMVATYKTAPELQKTYFYVY